MTRETVRKIQFVTFLFVHIPLVAVVAFAYYVGPSEQTALLAVAFLATLAAAILLWTYIGRAMAPGLRFDNA